MYRIFAIIFAVLIFAGCRSETDTSNKIPVNFDDNGHFIPVIDEIIPLETNDTFLIGNNYTFKTTAKYYIFGDDERILVFDKTGKAQSVISPIGQGPNETSSVSFFHAGDNSIMIAATGRKQIYEYDFEGNFIQAYNTSDDYFDFVSFNDLFLFDEQFSATDKGNVLLITDRDGKTVNDTIPIIAEGTNYGQDKIQVYGEYALFLPTMSDIIYKIGPTGHVSAAYSFDFGRYWLDSKESSEVSANSGSDSSTLWRYLQRNNKISFLRFLDTQEWLFLSFKKQDISYNWYYNKNSKSQYIIDLKDAAGNLLESCNIVGVDEGRFIAAVPAYSYSQLENVPPLEISEEDNLVLVSFGIEEEKQ